MNVVVQIRFRLRAVALPQFREGFAIAILRAHAEVARNGVQTPARLPVAKLPALAQVTDLVGPVAATTDAERDRDTMLPRPANQEGQINAVNIESNDRIDPAHVATQRLPELAQRPRLVVMANDDEFAFVKVLVAVRKDHPDCHHSPRERVERGLVEKVAAMIRFRFRNFLRNLRGVFQVTAFYFCRIKRRHHRDQLALRQRPGFHVKNNRLHKFSFRLRGGTLNASAARTAPPRG